MKSPPHGWQLFGWHLAGDWGPFTFYTSARKRKVWFPRAPPTSPPTAAQIAQRDKFRDAAFGWFARTPEMRSNWTRAARAASLSISGWNLFFYWITTGDDEVVATVAAQTGYTLE